MSRIAQLLERLLSRLHTLQGRIILLVAVLIVLIQALVLVLLDAALSRDAQNRLREELQIGERVFKRVLDQNARQLTQAAEVLSRDFGFREAVATRDLETIHGVLRNHGVRIGAGAMSLVSTDGNLIADTLHPEAGGKPFAYDWLLQAARSQGRAAGMVVSGSSAYQMVVVPVLAPEPIAWAAFGFEVDNNLVQDLESLTALTVAFLSRSRDGDWQLLAARSARTPLEVMAESILQQPVMGRPQRNALESGEFDAILLPIEERGNVVMIGVLQRSLDEALEPLRRLELLLLFIAAVSLLMAAAGSALVARGITRPISALAEGTRRVAEGQYQHGVDVSGPDEIAELARRFNAMREGIAAREEQILRLAYRDVLTELPNRALFYDRLGMAMELSRRTSEPLTILLMDLDRFKYVNDTLGHHVGDQVLQHTARRLTELVRRSDTIARLGGDEFAMLLLNTGIDSAAKVAAKALTLLEEPIVISRQIIDVRASIGIASFPLHAEDGETLLRHADAAMYAAKHGSLGYAVYEPGRDDDQGGDRLSLLTELRRAVAESELRLVYQPKVELATGAVPGVECLLRWNHPEREGMSPARFIPFAEETGFIKTLTEWVIRNAARQCGVWNARGRPLKVAVNISAQDLLNPNLAQFVASALEEHRVPPALFSVEVTESGFMQDPARAVELLARLADLGVHVSIDDFGTGYSSLAYLKQLPVHELKIDRSFVRNLAQDSKDRAIVLSTIELGHNLGLTVVAEGVEEEAARSLLLKLGCDLAQGYLFTPPLPPEELDRWLAARPPVRLVSPAA